MNHEFDLQEGEKTRQRGNLLMRAEHLLKKGTEGSWRGGDSSTEARQREVKYQIWRGR